MSDAVVERARQSVVHARRLVARGSALGASVAETVEAVDRLRRRSEALLPDGAPFVVTGSVDGRELAIRWERGRLSGDAAALDRVRLVVALHRRGAEPWPSLRGSRAQALLAVIRAFDHVTSVQVELHV